MRLDDVVAKSGTFAVLNFTGCGISQEGHKVIGSDILGTSALEHFVDGILEAIETEGCLLGSVSVYIKDTLRAPLTAQVIHILPNRHIISPEVDNWLNDTRSGIG